MLELTEEQRIELCKWASSLTMSAGDVFRARVILALAGGQTYSEIKITLGTSAPTISRWKQRFGQDGVGGLETRHSGSRPRVANAALQARMASRTRQVRPMAPVTGPAA